MNPFPEPLFRAAIFAFGTIVGSFLNVVIHRLPAGESIVHPRSRCPRCATPIPGWLNIPILSWLILRGRCWTCKAPISIRYPLVELLTGVLFLAVGVRYGWSLATIAGLIFGASLIAITFIDIDIWEIPDEISLPGVLVGCGLRPFAFDAPWWDAPLAAAAGAFALWFLRWIFYKLRGIEGIGLGDVKLIAMIGAFLGLAGLIPTILVGSITGTIIGLVVILRGRGEPQEEPPPPPEPPPSHTVEATGGEASNEEGEDWVPPPNAVPFGPFLSIGALAQLLIGPALERLFFGLG